MDDFSSIIFFRVFCVSEEINWLECLPWDGSEKSLPAGGIMKVPYLKPEDLVKSCVVIDAESEEGMQTLSATTALQLGRTIINVILNEKLIAEIERRYGERFALMIDPKTQEKLTRREWYQRHGTDGLALWALRNLRDKKRAKVFALGSGELPYPEG